MKILDLPVEKREKLGSAHSRRYRRAGMIPANLYGRGHENVNLLVRAHDFEQVLKEHTALVRLKLGDDVQQTALLRDVNWDVYGDHVLHIDLTRVRMEDEVTLKVPVHFIGIPAGISHGGQLQVVKADLEVHARVDSIPSDIKIDVAHLDIDDGVYVDQVEYPAHVRPAHEGRELIVHCVPPKKVEEPVPDEAEEAVVPEGAEAAPAEGAESPEPAPE